MLLAMLTSALMQGMIYAPMALGVYIAFKILETPDLTIDGSLVFGMTVCTVVTIAGHPIMAIFAGMIAGALAGLVTGLLQTKIHINAILSGILTMTALYTVNYAMLGGQSNRYLQGASGKSDTIFTMFNSFMIKLFGKGITKDTNFLPLILTGIITAIVIIIFSLFFKTRTGMAIRATGDNEDMVKLSSINADLMRIAGIILSNALVGLSGALLCQQQKYADLNFGTGMLVVGLASVIIGQVFFRKSGVTAGLISAVIGSLFYRIVLQIAYKIEMPSYVVKLLSASIVVIALAAPVVLKEVKKLSNKRIRNTFSGGEKR